LPGIIQRWGGRDGSATPKPSSLASALTESLAQVVASLPDLLTQRALCRSVPMSSQTEMSLMVMIGREVHAQIRRYERKPVILTTSRPFKERMTFFQCNVHCHASGPASASCRRPSDRQ
jgi:hypothetical protein